MDNTAASSTFTVQCEPSVWRDGSGRIKAEFSLTLKGLHYEFDGLTLPGVGATTDEVTRETLVEFRELLIADTTTVSTVAIADFMLDVFDAASARPLAAAPRRRRWRFMSTARTRKFIARALSHERRTYSHSAVDAYAFLRAFAAFRDWSVYLSTDE